MTMMKMKMNSILRTMCMLKTRATCFWILAVTVVMTLHNHVQLHRAIARDIAYENDSRSTSESMGLGLGNVLRSGSVRVRHTHTNTRTRTRTQQEEIGMQFVDSDDDADAESEAEWRKEMYRDAFPLHSHHTITSLAELQHQIHPTQQYRTVETNALRMPQPMPIPQNLNIVFMGDSLSRFQYLDLAYFLTHGQWVQQKVEYNHAGHEKPSMVTDHDYNDWLHFFNHTNAELAPYEQCDCYRKTGGSIVGGTGIIENRYFHDPNMNNTVRYLQKFGDYPFKSSWDVSDIHNNDHGPMILTESELKPLFWVGWVDAIRDFVCHMDPKPSVFVFNQGWWTNNDLVNVTLQHEILDALKECDIMSIYKTTNKGEKETDKDIAEYESQLCESADKCLDMTWTSAVPEPLYVDRNHFRSPVYTWMNLQLLSLLSSSTSDDDARVQL